MGTFASVTLDTESSPRSRRAVEAVREVFSRVNNTMSVYRKHSDVSTVNRWAGFRSIPVDPWLVQVVSYAKRAQFITEGVFSPILLAEGIRKGLKPPLVNVVPSNDGPGVIETSQVPPRIRLTRAGAGLDLGGIAKGFALDRAGAVLEKQGFHRYLLDLGRSLKLGDSPRGVSGWPVKLSGRPGVSRYSNLVISTSRQDVRTDTGHVVE
ncbi:MAG: FAD:protein FMN transferase, partial [bacterium]